MHQDFTLFATITMGLVTAFIGGYIARKLQLPSLAGYLLAGLAIGPFTPGFIGDIHDASQLAEMGVIFMMFGVGLHFSLKDLWRVRHVAVPGAVAQMVLATTGGFLVSQFWGWSTGAGLVLGLAISIASTVVLLRGLSDNGLLNTTPGKVAVGWLVLEDLATVAILVLLPTLVGNTGNPWVSMGAALLKTAVFVVLMLLIGTRFMPWLLTQIAYTHSRELFLLAVVGLSLGTAFAAYELFGVSLALGAFLAGVVVGESDVSHQVGAEILPFRDIFAVLFFVSVGMLVNPTTIWANLNHVLVLTLLIVVGKVVITLFIGTFLPASGRTMLVVAAGLSQIGEFSFIVGQAGVSLGLLTQDQYGLILAGALLSIIVNPLMFKAIPQFEKTLQKFPAFWVKLNGAEEDPVPLSHKLENHIVIVGYGRVGQHIGLVLKQLGISYLIVELDAVYANKIQKEGHLTLFGDASNSEILNHAGLEQAKALVVTVPNETTAELIVACASTIAPQLAIIARAGTASGVQRLTQLGAQHVIHPELEGGLEIVRHTLLTVGYSMGQIQPYIDTVRRNTYQGTLPGDKKYTVLDQLLAAIREVDITWQPLEPGSPIIGQSLVEANLRAKSGASIIALIRQEKVIPNPKSDMRFEQEDVLGLIGTPQELASAAALIHHNQIEPV